MALDPSRMGTAIAAAVKASAPVAGSPVTDAQLEAIWIAASTEIIKEFVSNGIVATIVATPDTLTGTGTGSIS